MKKVFKMFALAAMAFGLCMNVACGKDDPAEEENNANEGEAVAVLIDENFDTAMPSWTLIDADGDGNNWMLFEGYGIDGGNCMASASYDNNTGVLTPDNYIVTPSIHVHSSGGYTLTWYVAAQDGSYPADVYTVYAGTVTDGVFTPTATLYNETISSANFTQRSVSLDEFNGQDIQIAFRHHDCTDQFIMKIDNINCSQASAKAPATYPAVEGLSRK